MSNNVTIRHAKETNEGDNVTVQRLFPIKGYMNLDPFVLWDHFDVIPGSGFPDHPHRGFEGITYMFTGSMKHTDNLGNDSRVGAGGAQRFTAGKGIVHSEMPGSEGSNNGIQLWVNLPRKLKTLDPDYQALNADEIPEHKIEGATVRTIIGEGSPLKIKTPVIYEEIRLNAGATWKRIVPEGMQGFIYNVSGKVSINGEMTNTADAALLENVDSIIAKAEKDSHFMLCVGKPHGEPIKQWGPYVD